MDCALDEVLMSFQPLASNKDIVIERHFKEDTIFFGDEERLKQLMVILVDNAIKYNSKGGKIDIVLKENVNSVEISVLDTGEGIEEEHQDKIFERFYRIDKARSRNEGGTGLGLAIAKWIVDEHNGSIKVYSVPGKGSRFRIILPNDKNKKYSNNFKSST
jgi:signal transduction histidine kinase